MASYNTKEVPDLNTLPKSTYELAVVGADHSPDGDPTTIVVQFAVTNPPAYAGRRHFERYYLGTEDDPDAELPETKRENKKTAISWGRWNSLMQASGLYQGETHEEVEALNAAKPSGFTGDMTCRSYKDKESGEMKGPFNNIARFYAPGKKAWKEPIIEDDGPRPVSHSAAKAHTQSTEDLRSKLFGAEQPSGPSSDDDIPF